MNTPQPQSHKRHSMWPNFLWSIPLAALLVVAYLGIQALTQRGETVTVTFRRAPDMRPGETKVLYQGIEAGTLVKIKPNPDGRRFDFVLRLVPEAKPGLNTHARFWLIGGATPSLADLSSLRAVVSGVSIGYAPGSGGEPAERFEGLDQAPYVFPDDKGTAYGLRARKLGSVVAGSAILFRGQVVGRVTDLHFRGAQGFDVQIFLFQPYDSLVSSETQFWKISPLNLSFTAGGMAANLAPVAGLVNGGIGLDTFAPQADASHSPPHSGFVLYESQEDARQELSGPAVAYEFAFSGGVAGSLREHAPVTLLGFRIGEVASVQLAYDPTTGNPLSLATAMIYPQQLRLPSVSQRRNSDMRALTDASLRTLVSQGFRAELTQTPLLLGEESIALVKIKGASRAQLTTFAASKLPRFPSDPQSTGLENVTAQANQLLERLNGLPLEQIGSSVKEITGRLGQLASSPQVEQSLLHLNHALSSLDQILSEAKPQIQPLISHLNETATQLSGVATSANQLLEGDGSEGNTGLPAAIRELSEAARSVRALSDYLQRHPDAVLRGKKADQ